MVDVPDIEGELLVPRERVASVHLCPSGDSRPNVVAAHLLGCVPREVVHQERTRAYEAHVSSQHVDQLGELVEAGAPQEATDGGQPRLVGEQVAVGVALVDHGAELQHAERTTTAPRSLLTEQHRGPHPYSHQECDDGDDR